ncbi:glycosyltransferase family 1 protein [Rhodocytophaga rosea]|uniref:Glycosyltransferase family 1 protein n=1 Tax=Rhodocytophaga rosea TaxID=2704465 RepID=A0A6C0GL03_9BACT|nr:glycosyltransferase [Rhodocytophaga rosea]QHT68494.1 glycosyltransferase family 1 protein [Rhodocytophaga rosea]
MTTSILEDKDIVCLAFPSWDGNYEKSTVKIMSQLAKRNRVLYIDYPYTYKDIFTTWFGKQNAPVGRMLGTQKRLRKISLPESAFIHVLTTPPVLSVNSVKNAAKHRRLLQTNGNIVRKSILKAMKSLGMKDPLVVCAFNPFLGLPLLNQLNELATIYYCYDEISACNWTKNYGKQLEEEYIKKADTIIVSSDGLLKSKSSLSNKCYLVKNGVDFAIFNRTAELRQRNKNVDITVGYLGSLDERVDYELLMYLAEKLPDIKFEFVGRIISKDKAAQLDKFPNTKFWDAKKPEELPSYLKKFDAGIIPFLKNEQTAGIYPMKINEYLAGGIPVISTDFSPLPEFDSVIATASTHEAFLQAMMESLCNDTPQKRKERISIAAGNSWENKATQFSQAIADTLMRKNAVKPVVAAVSVSV